MKFTQKNISTQLPILKRVLGGELLVPVTLAAEAFTDGVCKAGNPISASGAKVNDGTAIGILLNDVYEDAPVGSLIKAFATVNEANANKNAGIIIEETVKTALPLIVFE